MIIVALPFVCLRARYCEGSLTGVEQRGSVVSGISVYDDASSQCCVVISSLGHVCCVCVLNKLCEHVPSNVHALSLFVALPRLLCASSSSHTLLPHLKYLRVYTKPARRALISEICEQYSTRPIAAWFSVTNVGSKAWGRPRRTLPCSAAVDKLNYACCVTRGVKAVHACTHFEGTWFRAGMLTRAGFAAAAAACTPACTWTDRQAESKSGAGCYTRHCGRSYSVCSALCDGISIRRQ